MDAGYGYALAAAGAFFALFAAGVIMCLIGLAMWAFSIPLWGGYHPAILAVAGFIIAAGLLIYGQIGG